MSHRDVVLLARRLAAGLYVHAAALSALRDGPLEILAPIPARPGGRPSGDVLRKDGTAHSYDWLWHAEAFRSDQELARDLDMAWINHALVVLGDRLAAEDYFDRAPVLELLRHLRNAAGHGNRFDIRSPEALAEWPAHNRDAHARSRRTFEISPDLDGERFLFEFMAAGDVLDVLISVGSYLEAVDPDRPWLRSGRPRSAPN